MSEEQTTEVNPIEQLRNEFQTQFDALKQSFEQSTQEKDKTIADLSEQLKLANQALLKSAFTERPAEPVKEKTQEELYAEKINSLYEKSLHYSKEI